jgi:hypothetical protein
MHSLKVISAAAVVVAALAIDAAPASAGPTVVPCGTAFNTLYTTSDYLKIFGTRVTSRGGSGFSSFTMSSAYSLSTTPLNTPAAASQSTFNANKGAFTNFEGLFNEVFPGRGNNDVDRWDFWAYSSGALYLKSITWGGPSAPWVALQGVVCYAGPQQQIIVTGTFDTPGTGTDFWNFVVVGATII